MNHFSVYLWNLQNLLDNTRKIRILILKFVTFSAKSLAYIAFYEFARWMPYTQRSLLVIFWWSIKTKLVLWHNSFMVLLILHTLKEVLVDGKIEIRYILPILQPWQDVPICIIYFWRSFSSDMSLLQTMLLIPT